MTVTVTLLFASASAAAAALSRIDCADTPSSAGSVPARMIAIENLTVVPTLAHEDRPDVGAPEAPLPPAMSADVAHAALVFGGAAAPAAPTLVPQAPVPTPPTAATVPTAAPGAEVDKTGLIWDARIHASTKTKKADGTWTARRNVDDTVRATIEGELRAGLAAPSVPTPPAAPLVAAAPTPPAPLTASVPTPPAPTAAAGPETFPQYMARLGSFYANRPVETHNKMAEALTPYGLATVGQLAGRPDLIPQVDAVFQALMAA